MKSTLFYYLFLPTLFLQFFGVLFYFIILQDSIFSSIIYTSTKIVLLFLPILFVWKFKVELPKLFSLKNSNIGLKQGLICGAFITIIIWLTYILFQTYFLQFAPHILQKVHDLHLTNIYIPFAIFISLFHSLLEEYFWRWFAYTGLTTRFSVAKSAFISSFAFASHHYIILSQFFSLPLTFLFGTVIWFIGFVWCVLYEQTESIYAPWIAHIFADAILMYIGYLLIF